MVMRTHADAVLVALRSSDSDLRAYGPDEVPPATSLQYPYVVVWQSRRNPFGVRRLTDQTDTLAWRVVTMCVGEYARDALWAEEKVRAAMEDRRVAVSGYSTSRCHFESESGVMRDPDIEKLYTTSVVWTFVSTPLPVG